MRRLSTLLLIVPPLTLGFPAAAQLPVRGLQLALGFGVDTTAAPAREVFELLRRYLTEPSDSARASLWSRSERAKWARYDLLAGSVYQGFSRFTVVRLTPAVGLPETWVLSTLVSMVDDSTRDVRPLALFRVYATRESGRWVLANALPRMTRSWPTRTFGAITFACPPGHAFDERRARRAAAFVDSLAASFGLPSQQPISYYFTDDLNETQRALGLEFFPLGADTVGGRSNVFARHAYVGSTAHGEDYLHELAHIVLASEVGPRTAGLLMEGLMTWAGGSAGLDYPQLLPGLARHMAAHPGLTLEALMNDPPPRTGILDVGYGGMAALCDLVHRRRGLTGLRAVLGAGRASGEVLDASARQLGVSRAELDSLWRATIAGR